MKLKDAKKVIDSLYAKGYGDANLMARNASTGICDNFDISNEVNVVSEDEWGGDILEMDLGEVFIQGFYN